MCRSQTGAAPEGGEAAELLQMRFKHPNIHPVVQLEFMPNTRSKVTRLRISRKRLGTPTTMCEAPGKTPVVSQGNHS